MKVSSILFAQRPLIGAGVSKRRRWYQARKIIDACRLTLPKPSLGQRQHRPAAGWTDPLVMLDAGIFHFVAITELPFHFNQILDMHAGSKWDTAATTISRFLAFANLFIEPDPQLSGPLKNVKELSKR